LFATKLSEAEVTLHTGDRPARVDIAVRLGVADEIEAGG
jgi:hypothetical protein